MIHGNTSGIKDYTLEQMELIYDMSSKGFGEPALLEQLAMFTGELNREISVFISRGGRILDVSVGSSTDVKLPHIRKRRGILGLSGVRCIHTHPSGTSHLSTVDIGTLISSRLDAMAALSVRDGKPVSLCVGLIGESLTEPLLYGPFSANRIPQLALMAEIERATRRVAELIRLHETDGRKERAMLIGCGSDEASMQELSMLADTAGAEVVSIDVQQRGRDKTYYIGQGKARELALKASALDADLAIFDDELSAIEAKNLEEVLGLKIIDRTTLILDIFARHASTREGRLQVELAQLKYNLPRLAGEGTALSRLGGGIGTRGPGEKKIEVDRRVIRRRIFELEREIDKLSEQRGLRRSEREKNRIKEIALVGYTNAGKSSLLNAISGAEALVENKLFATLDPLTRRIALPSGKEALLTDTVGFIEKLPHDLVSAFRSTLEEAMRADLLVNVVDVSSPEHERQSAVVRDVLGELGADAKPLITAYNKSDLLSTPKLSGQDHVFVSARSGEGLDELLELIEKNITPRLVNIEAMLGYDKGALLSKILEKAENAQTEYLPEGVKISASINAQTASALHLEEYIC